MGVITSDGQVHTPSLAPPSLHSGGKETPFHGDSLCTRALARSFQTRSDPDRYGSEDLGLREASGPRAGHDLAQLPHQVFMEIKL